MKNLDTVKWKSIKFKFNDENGKELTGVYFNPEQVNGEGPVQQYLQIPEEYQ